MYQKVRAYIREQKLLGSKDTVIAGISGGADSICLLFMLLELKKELNLELFAVHINHGLRGDSADADEAYVKAVCQEQGVECIVFHEDVSAYAKERRLTLEEAGREVRRKRFLQVLEERGAAKIALAHHKNDNAETFLWNLCRGSGLAGLRGILPKNGVWIHPLLCLSRGEIESYLEKREISYCTDETNLQDCYTRNRIRKFVIPYLEEHVNAKSVSHIAESMETLTGVWSFVDRETKRCMKGCVKRQEGENGCVSWTISEAELKMAPPELISHIIYRTLCEAAGRPKDIASVHVKAVRDLFGRQVGRKLCLPYGVRALRCYEGVSLERGRSKAGDADGLFTKKILEKPADLQTFPQNIYTKWFDYDIIQNALKIRHREPGDYIVIDKDGRTQKLKQYFINEKIPQNIRDSIWLVAEGHEILWIVGYRQSQRYQISRNTKRILEIQFYGGNEDERDN